MARRLLALLAAGATAASSRLELASRAWADVLRGVEDPWSGTVAVRALLAPLAAATSVAYTGNTSEAIAGFQLLASWQPPESLNAVAYVSQDGARLLVAFRGTTSAADRCADDQLFNPGAPQRKACARRAPSDLDYNGRAAAVLEQSRRLAPAARDVALTGHSLGCSLAQMQTLRLAASGTQAPSARALCFAPAGTRALAQRLGGLDPSSERVRGLLLALASPWDPVFSFPPDQQIGDRCVLSGTSEPLSCRGCHHSPLDPRQGALERAACAACFAQIHLFKNYLVALEQMKVRPNCTAALPGTGPVGALPGADPAAAGHGADESDIMRRT
jgi:hypothetical protein